MNNEIKQPLSSKERQVSGKYVIVYSVGIAKSKYAF